MNMNAYMQGYFRALFSCIERFLLSMDVKNLVLPAAEEAEPMWTKKLGFRKTSNEQVSINLFIGCLWWNVHLYVTYRKSSVGTEINRETKKKEISS